MTDDRSEDAIGAADPDDKGRVVITEYRMPMGHSQLQKPIFHSNSIYMLAYQGGTVDTFQCKLGEGGKVRDLKKVELGTTAIKDSYNSLATCTYRGRLYMFYDSMSPNDRWKYTIHYKTCARPEDGWAPPADLGPTTGLVGSYEVWWTRTVTGTIAAREINDKLFVIYYHVNHIHLGVFDGSEWKYLGQVHQEKYTPVFNVCTTTLNGKPVIIFGGFPQADERSIYLTAIDGDGKATPLTHFYLDWAKHNNMVGIAPGSVKDGAQANVIQVFCNNGGSKADVRRAECNLETGVRGQWHDSTIHGAPGTFCFCDAVVAALPENADSGDFQEYIVVWSAYFTDDYTKLTAGAYASDFFKCIHTSPTVYTGSKDTNQPSAWTLLGVIEGVPPFTRNGVDSTELTASVEYGQAVTGKIAVTMGIETAVSASIGAGYGAVAVSSELSATFAASNEMVWSEKREVGVSWSNVDRNHDGTWGGLVVSKPHLRGRNYTRFSFDKSRNLGTFYVVKVEDVTITIESYELAKPPAGMLPRQPSSNLNYWKGVSVPPYNGVDHYPINAVTATLTGGNTVSELWFETSTSRKAEASAKVTLTGSVENEILKILFTVGGSMSLGFSFGSQVTSEFSKRIRSSLRLLDPGRGRPGTVGRLVVQPHWQLAKENARLDPAKKPTWLPDQFVPLGLIPWCLNWKVLEADPDKRTHLVEAASAAESSDRADPDPGKP